MQCQVSIVIPACNEGPRIAAAVARAWETDPCEVIVVDGGSTDGTAEIAAGLSCRTLSAPRGRGRQQNYGARHARGDVLLFLHADNWLAAEGLRQIAEAMQDPTVVGGAFRQRIEAPGAVYRLIEWGNAWRAGRRGLPYGDQGIFLRRDVFEAVGGFPEVQLMEDVLLMQTLRRRRQGRLVLLPGPLHVSPRRWQRHGVIRQTLRNWALVSALRLGISPNHLARFYPRHS